MAQALTLSKLEVYCDACGHTQDATVGEVIKNVGWKCPACSTVMITQADADSLQEMITMADEINESLGDQEPEGPKGHIIIDSGTGGIQFEPNEDK